MDICNYIAFIPNEKFRTESLSVNVSFSHEPKMIESEKSIMFVNIEKVIDGVLRCKDEFRDFSDVGKSLGIEDEERNSMISTGMNLSNFISRLSDGFPTVSKHYSTIRIEDMMFGTIEGQIFLEAIFYEMIGSNKKLNLKTPNKYHDPDKIYFNDYFYYSHIKEELYLDYEGKDKWKVDKNDEERGQQDIEEFKPGKEFFGIDLSKRCVYVLKAVDEEDRDWYYVGQSSSILSRLQSHIRKGGDFSRPAYISNMRIKEIVEIREEASESGVYEEYVNNDSLPNGRILGGK